MRRLQRDKGGRPLADARGARRAGSAGNPGGRRLPVADRRRHGQGPADGQDLAQVRNLDRFRAQTVGFIFQLHNLLPTLTARENVEVPMRGQSMGRRARRQRSKELLDLVGLGDRMKHLPSQLSGGQRQRVAVARSLSGTFRPG